MATCNYLIKGVQCGIEIDEAGEEKCYVHKCMINKEIIADKNRFVKSKIFKTDVEQERLRIGFEFNFNEIVQPILSENISGVVSGDLNNYEFLKKANFVHCNPRISLHITNSVFREEVSFKGFKYSDIFNNLKITHTLKNTCFFKGADFRNAVFNNVDIKDVDFSKCLFAGAEFNNCHFVNVTWAKRSSWIPIIGIINKRKGVLYDELNLKRRDEKYVEKLSDLERIYRSLKALFKMAEDRDMEGEFNYSENEMLRKRKGFFKQIFTSKFWYFVGSRYGERPFWAFLNIFGIIVVFSFIFFFINLESLENGCGYSHNWAIAISHALSPFTFNKWQITAPSSLLSLFLTILEGSFLAIQIGLFVNALRRKLQR